MRLLVLAGILICAEPPTQAQGDLFQLTGDINVQWASPLEVVQGLGRKFYAGETLHLTVTGQFVQNNERTESHCAVFDWFCKDVRVPAPQTSVPAGYPPVVAIVAETGNTPHPSMPNQMTIPGAGYDLIIPEDATDGFGKAWRLKAMIPAGQNFDRSICVGTYTLHVTVDDTRRLAAFRNYLAAGTRTANELSDVLDERFTTHYGPQVADDLAAAVERILAEPG